MGLEETLDSYVVAWNTRDPDLRSQLLARAVTEDCRFVGPTGTFRGHPAIDSLIISLQGRLNGASVVRTGPAFVDGSARARFGWEIRSADDVVLFAGEDSFEMADDGRLSGIRVEL